MIRLIVGIVGLIATWSYRPPSGMGDAFMMLGRGQSFFLKEPVFLALMALFALLAIFGLIDLVNAKKGGSDGAAE
jgi:uncharacterized membrane protein